MKIKSVADLDRVATASKRLNVLWQVFFMLTLITVVLVIRKPESFMFVAFWACAISCWCSFLTYAVYCSNPDDRALVQNYETLKTWRRLGLPEKMYPLSPEEPLKLVAWAHSYLAQMRSTAYERRIDWHNKVNALNKTKADRDRELHACVVTDFESMEVYRSRRDVLNKEVDELFDQMYQVQTLVHEDEKNLKEVKHLFIRFKLIPENPALSSPTEVETSSVVA